MVTLIHLVKFRLHIIPKIVKTELVIGCIGYVTTVSGVFFSFGLLGIDDAGGQAQCRIDLAHPIAVTPRQIIVYSHYMHALAGQSVEIGRKGGNKGLALAGLHLRNITLV